MSYLKKGDKIAIIAPSGSLRNKDIKPTLSYFKSLGLEVVLADNIAKNYRYMAGTDKERASTINAFFSDSSVKAIFCLRGGAGASRMLPYLDFNLIKNNPKPIFGLSDSTALQNALISQANNPSFTGFLPVYDLNDREISPQIHSSLINSLFENVHEIKSGICLNKGTSEGIIVGGCLSVFLYLCGTPYFPDLKDKIILIEDIAEKTYKIDLMLNQLKQQKNFNKIKGIIFGAFTDCPIIDQEDGTIDDCINDFCKDLCIPIIKDFSYGHILSRSIVPLGIKAKISSNTNECMLTWKDN